MTKNRDDRHLWLECKCWYPTHSVRFTLDRTGPLEDPEILVETLFTKTVWYRRIWRAIKYVFTGEMNFTTTMLTEEGVEELVKFITIYKVLIKVRKAKRTRIKELNEVS